MLVCNKYLITKNIRECWSVHISLYALYDILHDYSLLFSLILTLIATCRRTSATSSISITCAVCNCKCTANTPLLHLSPRPTQIYLAQNQADRPLLIMRARRPHAGEIRRGPRRCIADATRPSSLTLAKTNARILVRIPWMRHDAAPSFLPSTRNSLLVTGTSSSECVPRLDSLPSRLLTVILGIVSGDMPKTIPLSFLP